MQPNTIEHNGELLEFRGTVPGNVKWLLHVTLRLRCPACDEFITADPSFAETCPCGRLKRRGTSDTIQVAGYPVTSVSIWHVIPKEDLAEADTLIAVLGAIMRHVRVIGDQQMVNRIARCRRLLGAGDREGAREIVERLEPDIDRVLDGEAVDDRDHDERQAFLDLGRRAVALAQDVIARD